MTPRTPSLDRRYMAHRPRTPLDLLPVHREPPDSARENIAVALGAMAFLIVLALLCGVIPGASVVPS